MFIGILGLLFGVPIIFSPYTECTVFLMKAVFFQTVVFALFILLVVKKFLKKEPFVSIPLKVPMLLFLCLGFLSFARSPYSYAIFEELLRFLSFFFLYILVLETVTNHKRKAVVLDSLTLVTFIVCVYGVLQRMGFYLFNWIPAGGLRISSFFGNPNLFATYLVAVIPLLFVLFLEKTKLRKVIAGITLGLALVCLTLTGTRSAWVAFVASFIFFILLIRWIKAIRLNWENLLRFGTLLLIILLLVVFNWNMIAGRILQVTDPFGSVFIRIHIWEVTLNIIKSTPILGTGLGTFQIEFPKFKYPDFDLEVRIENLLHAHNEYLEILAEMGILGLGIFLWLMISFFGYAFKYLKNKGGENLTVVGLISGIVAVLVASLFSVSLRWTGPAFIFWFLIGLTMVIISPKTESKEPPKKPKKGRFSHLLLFSVALISIFLIAGWYIRMYQANVYLARGEIFLKKGMKGKAIFELKRSLDKNPFCVVAIYLLGCLNVEPGSLNEAQSWFEKLEKLAPDFTNVHEWKGQLYFRLNDFAKAGKEYKLATKSRGTISNHNMLGRIYFLEKKWDLAIEEFERACQRGANFVKSLAKTKKDLTIEMKPAYKEKDEIINAFIYCAKAYYEIGEYEKSIQKVEKIEKETLTQLQTNTVVHLYTNIAWNYAKKGENLDKAIQLCRKALGLNFSHPEIIHYTFAWVYFKKGRFNQAKKEMQKALELAPGNQRFKKHLSIMEDAIKGRLQNVKMGEIEK